MEVFPNPVVVVQGHRRKRPRRGNPMIAAARARSAPEEIFECIIRHLMICPRPRGGLTGVGAVLLLSMVNKTARKAVVEDTNFWFEWLKTGQSAFFRGANMRPDVDVCYLPGLPNIPLCLFPNIIPTRHARLNLGYMPRHSMHPWPGVTRAPPELDVTSKALLAKHARKVASLAHLRRCTVCGKNGRVEPIWHLNLRICALCKRDRFVSHVAVFHDYGVNLWHHPDLSTAYFVHVTTRGSRNAVSQWSVSAQDRRANHIEYYFFWRPHVERLLKLERERRAGLNHLLRAEPGPALALAALVRAFHVRLVIAHQGRTPNLATSHAFYVGAMKEQPEDRLFINRHLPVGISRPQSDDAARARQLLQRAFLEHVGRITLPCANRKPHTLHALRQVQAQRPLDDPPHFAPVIQSGVGDGSEVGQVMRRFRAAADRL